jgi:hypothetical protein
MGLVSWARRQPRRIKFLVTGYATTVNEDGTFHARELHSWKIRWAISGVHSRNWKWVNRWGKMPCGCTRNPVTRKLVWIRGDCPEHGVRRFRSADTVD